LGLAGLVYYFKNNFSSSRFNSPFLEAHERAATSFAAQKGFGSSRLKQNRFWNEFSIAFDSKEYRIGEIQLIGIVDRNSPILYLNSRPPKKSDLAEEESRALNLAETAALAELLTDSPYAKTTSGGTTEHFRVMAPLKARQDCAECHDVPLGTILGAFIYTLTEYPDNEI
jgi:hypothetical protein